MLAWYGHAIVRQDFGVSGGQVTCETSLPAAARRSRRLGDMRRIVISHRHETTGTELDDRVCFGYGRVKASERARPQVLAVPGDPH
jgi:hypothetical protein